MPFDPRNTETCYLWPLNTQLREYGDLESISSAVNSCILDEQNFMF